MGFSTQQEEFGIAFHDGYSIKTIQEGKGYRYILFDEHRMNVFEATTEKSPSEITARTKVGKKIKEHSKDDSEFDRVRRDLGDLLIHYMTLEIERERALREEEVEEKRKLIDDAMSKFQRIDDPLIWLASKIDWITAGERRNIMIAFLALVSQVVLHTPISVIGLGKGSSGKTHVMETAMALVPDEFILMEKKPTLASMFHRSQINPYYYNGKIVNYGDMGGVTDQDDVNETKNIIKELQTEGYVNRPITIKSGDGFEVVDLELFGNPCLYYTTVPGFEFDGQELSRSIQFTPRVDNKDIFDCMSKRLNLQGKTYRKVEETKEELTNLMPYVVYGLREKVSGTTFDKEDDKTVDFEPKLHIINPYHRVIIDFIGDSEYYKRDGNKYEAFIKSIAVLNYYNHEIYDTDDGEKVLFVTFDDIMLFLTLFENYRLSIRQNLTQTQSEIYQQIEDQYDEAEKGNGTRFLIPYNEAFKKHNGFVSDDELEGQVDFYDGIDELVTTTSKLEEYLDYSLRTIQDACYAFRQQGLCRIEDVPKSGKTNYYYFYSKDDAVIELNKIIDNLTFTDEDYILFEEEYPKEAVDFLRKDKVDKSLSIFNQHKNVKPPVWNNEAIVKKEAEAKKDEDKDEDPRDGIVQSKRKKVAVDNDVDFTDDDDEPIYDESDFGSGDLW